MGNLGSIKNIIKKIGHQSQITSDKAIISNADKLILPGVGSFDKAMANLAELGLIELIKQKAAEGTPLLGICLGMQLLANNSEEGKLEGLGIISGEVKEFKVKAPLKVPHMGWNVVQYNTNCALYKNFDDFEETRFYFVHSYHYVCTHKEHIAGTTTYESPFTSSIYHNNVYGAQFHPEKSHKYGMQLLKNFIENV
jgi:imidazole glycerol-phosphate synthase subunit HisH